MGSDLIKRYPLVTSNFAASVRLHQLPAYQHDTRGKSDADHRHDFHQLLYFRDSGLHHVDFRVHDFAPHSLLFLPAGAVHRFDPGALATGFALNVGTSVWSDAGAVARATALALSGSPTGVVDRHWQDAVSRHFRMVGLELRREEPCLVLQGLLDCLLGLTLRALSVAGPVGLSPLAVRYLELVERTYTEPISVTESAERLGVAERTLYTATQRGLGKTPGQLLQDRQLLEAKRLLAHTLLTVSEIAYQVGFRDPAYFARFFKKSEGWSPSEFRRS